MWSNTAQSGCMKLGGECVDVTRRRRHGRRCLHTCRTTAQPVIFGRSGQALTHKTQVVHHCRAVSPQRLNSKNTRASHAYIHFCRCMPDRYCQPQGTAAQRRSDSQLVATLPCPGKRILCTDPTWSGGSATQHRHVDAITCSQASSREGRYALRTPHLRNESHLISDLTYIIMKKYRMKIAVSIQASQAK